MIFVIVGTHNIGFERLVIKMDSIAGKIDESVIMQIGSTKYIPINAQFFNFADEKKMKGLYQQSRLIISHAGAGTILDALSLRKKLILVPRLEKFNECYDDQQIQLARILSEWGRAFTVHDIELLEESIYNSNTSNQKTIRINDELVKYLKSELLE